MAFGAAVDPTALAMQLIVPGAAFVLLQQSPVALGALVARGRPEPERAFIVQQRESNSRHELLIDILSSELFSAMQLMDHRERQWAVAYATQSQPLVWRWSECARAKSQPLKAWSPT